MRLGSNGIPGNCSRQESPLWDVAAPVTLANDFLVNDGQLGSNPVTADGDALSRFAAEGLNPCRSY
jgi:hypothetical protein